MTAHITVSSRKGRIFLLHLQVSQNWFGDEERSYATLILGMSNPVGLVLGQSLTPLFVKEHSEVYFIISFACIDAIRLEGTRFYSF